jgi:DNA (cytosine-5)-methyltransferase 1
LVTNHFSAGLSDLDQAMVSHIPPGGNWKDIPTSIPSRRLEQIRASSKAGLGSRSTYYGRLRWDRPGYTISTYFNRPGNGCYIHPTENRLISLREAARLQTFPDSFEFTGSTRKRCAQIGNAVPPLLAYSIARALPQGRYVDAFCGAGGVSLGFDWAGSECVAAVDNDEACIETFSRNRMSSDDSAVLADLSSEDSYRRFVMHVRSKLSGSTLDILIGGPPCQGFSTAGDNRREDPRNLLIWSFAQLAEDLQPELVIMENVPALSWKRSAPTLRAFLRRLESLGYKTVTVTFHAETFGVPQTRRRLFVIAAKDPKKLRVPVPFFGFIEPSYWRRQPGILASDVPPLTVQDAMADLPGITVGHPDEEVKYKSHAKSQFGRWLRGETTIESMVAQPIPDSLLLLPEWTDGL